MGDSSVVPMKRCRNPLCGKLLPLDQFHKDRQKKADIPHDARSVGVRIKPSIIKRILSRYASSTQPIIRRMLRSIVSGKPPITKPTLRRLVNGQLSFTRPIPREVRYGVFNAV
jgi:hypothetical protein